MNSNGLSNSQVLINRKKYGSNSFTKYKKESFIKLLIMSLGDPIIKILLIALGIKLIFLFNDQNYYETFGILIAIFLAAFISSISEYGSEKAFLKLQDESSKIKCKAKRNNNIVLINIDDIVVGDIILLNSGDKIPADGILINGELEIDESSITGESKEVYKKVNDKLFRGTVINNSNGIMRVNEVGDNTFFGNVASMLQDKQPTSPLKLRLSKLAKVISFIGYIGAILVSFSYLFKVFIINNNFDINKILISLNNYEFLFSKILQALTLAVTIIVVAVPEGLPMMITLVLSMNMKRMLKKNVLVRKLNGIETAGSVNILFSDKTGTLTKGNLVVNNFINFDTENYNDIRKLKNKKLYDILKLSIYYNTDCILNNDKAVISGNATDKSIFNFLDNLDVDKYDVIYKEKFSSEKKYMYTIINKNKRFVFIKGAYEKLIKHCNYYYDNNLNKNKIINKDKFINKIENEAKKGNRIILIVVNDNYYDKEILKNLTIVGALSLGDEIREEAVEGIKLVKRANIKTVMLTGDNIETARSVSETLGLIENKNDLVITSLELNKMSDNELKNKINLIKVVARSLPADKTRLIRISQEMGLVVGMTGDGVNDAGALKKADVGFSMGSGTEVSKEASDIVLVDNNFMSIVNAILFGRTIFKSIRKFIIFQLTVNFCAVVLSILGPFIGIECPVTIIQMLWINMIMDTFAGIAFAFEPPLKEYMDEKPKKRDESIINKYMINEILVTGTYITLISIIFLKLPFFHNLFRISINDEYLLSAFFGLFIFITIFNAFNCRTHRINIIHNIFSNKVFIFIILFISIAQLYMIYFGGNVFRTVGLTLFEFNIMLFISFSVIPFDMLRKILLRKKGINSGV